MFIKRDFAFRERFSQQHENSHPFIWQNQQKALHLHSAITKWQKTLKPSLIIVNMNTTDNKIHSTPRTEEAGTEKIEKTDVLHLLLKRIAAKDDYTIGHLYANGKLVCDTLEKTDRGLQQGMSTEELLRRKITGKTAIPTGTYKITMGHKSPKFSAIDYYNDFCGGYMPRLLNVPAFEGILIHRGNWKEASEGCLLVGENTSKGGLSRSKPHWEALMKDYLMPAQQRDIDIIITIMADYA